MKHKTGQKSTW